MTILTQGIPRRRFTSDVALQDLGIPRSARGCACQLTMERWFDERCSWQLSAGASMQMKHSMLLEPAEQCQATVACGRRPDDTRPASAQDRKGGWGAAFQQGSARCSPKVPVVCHRSINTSEALHAARARGADLELTTKDLHRGHRGMTSSTAWVAFRADLARAPTWQEPAARRRAFDVVPVADRSTRDAIHRNRCQWNASSFRG
jgi:hypothetical protein